MSDHVTMAPSSGGSDPGISAADVLQVGSSTRLSKGGCEYLSPGIYASAFNVRIWNSLLQKG